MKCDKCKAKGEVYQCGDQWLCRNCYPKDRMKELYPLWAKQEKGKQ